jgi:bacterioferritin-associated ferredoxin
LIVCQCHAVTDRDVRRAVAEGAHTLADVGAVCGAGADCGSCHATVEHLISVEFVCARSHGARARTGELELSPA